MTEYQPRAEQEAILDKAMAHIRSVPYNVSARWLFYRLLGDVYHFKEDYHGKFLPLTAKARKNFYKDWRPDTLADDTREVIDGGTGFFTVAQWLAAIYEQETYLKNKWESQQYYIELWFEAKAMIGQFQYYTKEIPLMPFGGDISIHAKWKTAERLERAYNLYGYEVVILYFGDDDKKGQEIPDNARKDIELWANVPFHYERVALNPGDGDRYGLPDNPEKPGTYQWEALEDDQASVIISDAVSQYYDFNALEEVEAEQEEKTEIFREKFQTFIDNYDDGDK